MLTARRQDGKTARRQDGKNDHRRLTTHDSRLLDSSTPEIDTYTPLGYAPATSNIKAPRRGQAARAFAIRLSRHSVV
jgi:hypothetical protein